MSELATSPYMALMLARVGSVEELREHLWAAGITVTDAAMEAAEDPGALRAAQDHIHRLGDRDLLLNTAIELVDFQYLEDAVQHRSLRWLNQIALARPTVLMHLYVFTLVLFSPSILLSFPFSITC